MIQSARCAIYARFSFRETERSFYRPTNQEVPRGRTAKAFAFSMSGLLPTGYFRGDGRSGRFAAVLTAAKKKPRPFDVILVDDTSRLSRKLSDALRIKE